MKVGDVMTTGAATVRPDASLAEAARIMVEHRISGLPVIDSSGTFGGHPHGRRFLAPHGWRSAPLDQRTPERTGHADHVQATARPPRRRGNVPQPDFSGCRSLRGRGCGAYGASRCQAHPSGRRWQGHRHREPGEPAARSNAQGQSRGGTGRLVLRHSDYNSLAGWSRVAAGLG